MANKYTRIVRAIRRTEQVNTGYDTVQKNSILLDISLRIVPVYIKKVISTIIQRGFYRLVNRIKIIIPICWIA